jgi:hypothetical protein
MTDTDARAAITDVMARYPDLTTDGLNGHRRANFSELRADLLHPNVVREFEQARVWFILVPRRQSPNRDCDSYRIKHVIERWWDGYIANGACIAAALSLGVPISTCPSGINAWLGIAGPRKWPAQRVNRLVQHVSMSA